MHVYLSARIVLAMSIAFAAMTTTTSAQVVKVPAADKPGTKDSQILLLSMLINLTPGSVALDVSPDRRFMYVHVMYIDTPDAARDEIKHGFERRVLQLLG